MECPVCRSALMVMERQCIELDVCPKCRGVWFDEEELARLCEALDQSVKLPDTATLPVADVAEKPYRCPRCRKKMDKVLLGNHDPVIVDRCPLGEGLWLDAGELDAVIRHHQAHQDPIAEEPVIEFVGALFEPHPEAAAGETAP